MESDCPDFHRLGATRRTQTHHLITAWCYYLPSLYMAEPSSDCSFSANLCSFALALLFWDENHIAMIKSCYIANTFL